MNVSIFFYKEKNQKEIPIFVYCVKTNLLANDVLKQKDNGGVAGYRANL